MKHSTFRPSRMAALLCAGAMGFAVQAHALDIDASNLSGWTLNTNYWELDGSPAAINAAYVKTVTGFSGTLAEVYKIDYDDSAESGAAAPYYLTTFSGDPNGAVIDQSGAYYIACPDCYLVVKDGNADPDMYIFDISSWNGTDDINLSNFWNGPGGAISYVGIYNNISTEGGGGSIAMIPEADTYAMLLAGLGLVGFAARRKRVKTA